VATTLIAVTAAAAIAAGVLLLAAGTGPGPSAGSGPAPTLTEATGCCRDVPLAARATLESMVSLQVLTAHGVVQECGVVVAAGGLVATTLDALAGARSITAVTAAGRRLRVVVVAGDPDSDVAVVRVFGPLPTARFVPAGADTQRRGLVLAMALAAGTRATGSATMMWAGSKVRAFGADISGGGASGMGGIAAAAPSMPSLAGEALVQSDGRVLGLLDTSATSRSAKVFLPAALVVGVARSLATAGRVQHGWLDVAGVDSSTVPPAPGPGASTTTTAAVAGPPGAVVASVESYGAAAGILQPGDVITSIDGAPLTSMAALRSSLYVTSPGQRVELGIRRGRTTLTVGIALSGSP
jgi:S1-C subfamily serine protease